MFFGFFNATNFTEESFVSQFPDGVHVVQNLFIQKSILILNTSKEIDQRWFPRNF